MPIPDYQTAMLPLLRLASDGAEHTFRQAVDTLADEFHLSDEERSELLPSGTAPTFSSRVGWARTYLKQAGLLMSPKRGVFQVTAEGAALLARAPVRIDNVLLNQYESFRAFRSRGRQAGEEPRANPIELAAEQTPEDAMAAAYERIRANLEAELLEQVKASSPAFFERLVVDLLVAMGYGGSRSDAGRDYVNLISTKIILIDGDMLTSLMVDHNVAVARTGLYELKRIDADYFEGE